MSTMDLVIVCALFALECCFLWFIWEQHKTIMALLRKQGEEIQHIPPMWAVLDALTPDRYKVIRRRKSRAK